MKNNKIEELKFNFIDLIADDFFAISASAGHSKNGRDSISKRLGVKKFGGQNVKKGEIIVRQKGKKFKISKHDIFNKTLKFAKNFDIIALRDGIVKFFYLKKNNKKTTFVTII